MVYFIRNLGLISGSLPDDQGGFTCMVSKEKKLENVNLSDLAPRSMNDLDL